MFAKWIPEALDQIEALAELPEPPSSLTIAESRKLIVNETDGLPNPGITTLKAEDGEIAISVKWAKRAYTVLPDGSVFYFD